MKSFEELEMLTIPQLTAIATDLGVDVPKKTNKAAIVQLVYDVQQPAPDESDEDVDSAPEANKDVDTEAAFERDLQTIVDHFNGTVAIEVDETTDGAAIFAVMDELTDEELARGTFLELLVQVAPKPNEPVDLDKEAGVGQNDLVEDPDFEEINTETPPLADDDNLTIIEKGLKPLRHYGLTYSIEGSVIKLRAGSKNVTTTLNQPTHRVIRTAEQLCNR